MKKKVNKSLVSFRWGGKRPPASLIPVSSNVVNILRDRVAMRERRAFVDRALCTALLIDYDDLNRHTRAAKKSRLSVAQPEFF